jgi:archaemetzincin
MRYIFFFLSFLLVCCQSDEREVYFESVAQNDIAVSKPKRGEWLDAHHENGQAFDQFVQSKPVKPTAGKQAIYLIPIGKFTALPTQTEPQHRLQQYQTARRTASIF